MILLVNDKKKCKYLLTKSLLLSDNNSVYKIYNI